MMKKHFDLGVLLLPLGYLLFALVLFIGFMPEGFMSEEQMDYPTEAEVRTAFDARFEAFGQVSRALWEHPEYFDALHEKETSGFIFAAKNALEEYRAGGYLTGAEWDRIKAISEIVQPYEIAMRSHEGVNAIEWMFIVQEPGEKPYTLALYYCPAPEGPTPEKNQAALDSAITYFGRYGILSPMEGKDSWYEVTIFPTTDMDDSIKTTTFKE